MKGDLDPAVSLLDEADVTPEMMERIRTGKDLKIQDQVWVLMQACSKFIDILDAIPEEHKEIIDAQLVSDAVMMVLVAARDGERTRLGQYVTGEIDESVLDGTLEAEHDKGV